MRPTLLLLSFLLFSLSGCISDASEEQAMAFLADALESQNTSGHILVLGAAVATGQDIHSWPDEVDPLVEMVGLPKTLGDQARLLHALGTAGEPPEALTDLVAAVWSAYDGEQFGAPDSLMDDALAVAALMAAGTEPDDARIQHVTTTLRDAQSLDGGWNWNGQYQTGSTSIDTTIQGEPDETAFVLRALDMASALDERTRDAAIRFLDATMRPDGFYAHGGTVNCQSTGLALLAWSHVDEEPTPLVRDAVLSCQNPDGGFPHVKGGPSQVWATTEIVLGLAASS